MYFARVVKIIIIQIFSFTRLILYFNCLKVLKEYDVSTSILSDIDLNHILGVAKLCGFGFLVFIFAWSPFLILCSYTLIAGANELNIYMTMIPPIMAKVKKHNM